MNYALFERVREIIVRNTGFSSEIILPTSTLSDHDGIDSLTQLEIIMDIEDSFNIVIPDDVVQKITSINDMLKYLEIGSEPSADLMPEPANRTDEFCQKLVNGQIEVADIPDEAFVAVTERAKFSLPRPTMQAVVHRLEGLIAEKEQVLIQKRCETAELEQQIQQNKET